eukprot:1287496-Prymnesium_polylepis.1
MGGGAACGQGRGRRGEERLTPSLLPRSNALRAARALGLALSAPTSPQRNTSYIRRSRPSFLSGILRIAAPNSVQDAPAASARVGGV